MEQHTDGPNKVLLNNHKLQSNSSYEHLVGEVHVGSSSIISQTGSVSVYLLTLLTAALVV
jgi:hypothetical protein